ncbi:RelA/SpoT domain-containing protein [Pontibacter mangrovi]|uniref:RelA/SpoT domain-containing protein n=1 Tax=Pontibacter mangrovi TaxID=2589816 RepID=A0A501W1T5_9BACT|nr:RelA/SpoT domain-containing protein [Pontibacter mangrovi]TPE42702.1 hypothetical protein FJM65_16705 [Pontibacter mangrovi]
MERHRRRTGNTLSAILGRLGTSERALHDLELDPQALLHIYHDYRERQPELQRIGALVAGMLAGQSEVHSVQYRIKDPLHLLHKIIRKKREYPERNFNQHTYLSLINDLVGVRALHLYRESWLHTSRYVQRMWPLKRPPYAYVGGGENEQHLHSLARLGCQLFAHPQAYKAIHFVIETQPARQRYYAEVQLRTVFEEGWSEIDHTIRYPFRVNNPQLDRLLQLLNKLTSQADNLASLIHTLAHALGELPSDPSVGHQQYTLQQLQSYITGLPLKKAERQQLYRSIASALQARHPR